jgi:YfiH family protein
MYQIPQLLKFSNLVHGFSTINEGNMATSFGGQTADPNKIFIKRKGFLTKLGVDIAKCVGMWHQQSNKVCVVEKTKFQQFDFQRVAKLDGLITNKRDQFLFMVVADCLPIIIFDPKKEAVASVHAGWKGVNLEIPKVAVKSLQEEYGCDPKDLVVGFGPAARKDSFVKENPGQRNDPRWKGFVEKVTTSHSGVLQRRTIESCTDARRSYRSLHSLQDDLYKIDFVGLARKQLIDVGVRNTNIFDCGIDTIKDKRFFSHYRDKKLGKPDQGRFACVVGTR